MSKYKMSESTKIMVTNIFLAICVCIIAIVTFSSCEKPEDINPVTNSVDTVYVNTNTTTTEHGVCEKDSSNEILNLSNGKGTLEELRIYSTLSPYFGVELTNKEDGTTIQFDVDGNVNYNGFIDDFAIHTSLDGVGLLSFGRSHEVEEIENGIKLKEINFGIDPITFEPLPHYSGVEMVFTK
jgi:hypothetical protein